MAFATTVLNFSNVDCIFTQILKHLFKGIRDSKFNITQCDVFDKNGIQSLNTLKKFITTVMRSSFNADKISFKLLGALGNVSMLDILALSWNKIELYRHIFHHFNGIMNNLNQDANASVQLKIFNHVLSISSHNNKIISVELLKAFIQAYKCSISNTFYDF